MNREARIRIYGYGLDFCRLSARFHVVDVEFIVGIAGNRMLKSLYFNLFTETE